MQRIQPHCHWTEESWESLGGMRSKICKHSILRQLTGQPTHSGICRGGRRVKFFFADSLDCVDPNFDFLNDRFSPGRNRQSGDFFAHEVLGQSPYHGLLLSYAAVGTGDKTSRFSQGQRLRLFRDGVHSFYRYPYAEYSGKREDYPIMGDSGAFSFRNYDKLPFTLQELYYYYATCGFTLEYRSIR